MRFFRPSRPTPPLPVRVPTHPRRSLEDAVAKPILRKWGRRMIKELRRPRPLHVALVYDALEWLPFQLNIDNHLDKLADEVRNGTYLAARPEIVRAAKSLGLTRPLAFLAIRDAVLYKNIVAIAENDLLGEMQPFTRFGRADDQGGDQRFDPDSGWFRAWLKRNAQLWTITENHDWIVETDISNFFPSIHLDSVLDHLIAHSRIGVDVVRLLSHMLRQFAPVPEYRVSPLIGLPQEPFDCSRVIAHSFLGPVDEAFLEQGTNHQFSRYMDDIAIGASSHAEGMEFVSRAQRTLEKLGLYPNAAKTRVVSSTQFVDDYMKDENDYIGDVERTLDEDGSVDVQEVEGRLLAHLALEHRPKGWERVLRRYATLCRQLRSPVLLERGIDLIPQLPGSTRSILDYAATFPVTTETIKRLRERVSTVGSIYEDVRALPLEFLGVAPLTDDPSAENQAVSWATEVFADTRATAPRLAAIASILIAKFGSVTDLDFIAQILDSGRGDPDPVRRQLLVLALASQRLATDQIARFGVESAGMAEAVEFLMELTRPEHRFVESSFAVCKPRQRKQPRIWMIPPRGLFLGVIAARADPGLGKSKIKGFMNLLNQNEESLRDRAGMRWLGDSAS